MTFMSQPLPNYSPTTFGYSARAIRNPDHPPQPGHWRGAAGDAASAAATFAELLADYLRMLGPRLPRAP